MITQFLQIFRRLKSKTHLKLEFHQLANCRKSLRIMTNQNNAKTETNIWTRLLIFDDMINFYMTSVVYCGTFLHFISSLFNNKKKTLKIIQYDVERLLLCLGLSFLPSIFEQPASSLLHLILYGRRSLNCKFNSI